MSEELKPSPAPWKKGVFETTDDFRKIEYHECLGLPDGSLIAVFGPALDKQSIADRDFAERAIRMHERLLSELTIAHERDCVSRGICDETCGVRDAIAEAQP